MLFMNEDEIADAAERYADHPVLGPATRTLANLCEATNANSDGWCYWPKPCRAAKKLQELIQGNEAFAYRFDDEREDATPAALSAALRPIKAFRTRSGIAFDIEEIK